MKQASPPSDINIRRMRVEDNPAVARIIREVMTEFGAVGCGYSINDPEVDDMYAAYSHAGHAFYVVELGGRLLGCAGFGPLQGGNPDTCELRKMYFLPELRGIGAGSMLMRRCLEDAAVGGFKRCYLETTDNMHQARRLYERHGFEHLAKRMGDTGHAACGTWMAREL
jgi:putative acetyltransferase